MNLIEYQKLAMRTEKLFDEPMRVAHATLGALTELGELGTAVKRVVIYGKAWDFVDPKAENRQTIRQNALEEIGDAAWYIAILFNLRGVPMSLAERHVEPAPPTTPEENNIRLLNLSLDAGVRWSKLQQNAFNGEHEILCAQILLSTLDQMCTLLYADFGDALSANISKLKARYPDKYSDAAAEARADKGGLSARLS